MDLRINTYLASPQAEAMEAMEVGSILAIHAVSATGPILAVSSNGETVGSIISREQIRLLKCLVKGVNFIAEVISINGAECRVQIRPE